MRRQEKQITGYDCDGTGCNCDGTGFDCDGFSGENGKKMGFLHSQRGNWERGES